MPTDPIKRLQAAARAAAEHIAPGERARRVLVFSDDGRNTIDITVPACALVPDVEREAVRGWEATERSAGFDGRAVAVSVSRLRLLRTLADADHALTAKELTALAFDKHTDEANTRYHLRELRRELKAAFPTFEGEIVAGDGDGYRLVLR